MVFRFKFNGKLALDSLIVAGKLQLGTGVVLYLAAAMGWLNSPVLSKFSIGSLLVGLAMWLVAATAKHLAQQRA